MIASTEMYVPVTIPIIPRNGIIKFFATSDVERFWFQKHIRKRRGGKIKANPAANVAPTNDMKLSSCGTVIASAPVRKKK